VRSPIRSNATADVPQRRLRQAVEELKDKPRPDRARRLFAELRATLQTLPPEAASATIRDFLDARLDTPSGLEFAVGPDGFLKQPSSLRVFLLDELMKVDTNAAVAYAEQILASKDSADEWAVSLRNYALGRTNAEARLFLQQKVREMIQHEPWQKNPSIGFLEAFDVAVHAGGTELMPDLTELLRQKDNQAVAHAAYLALDRLTLREPVTTLEKLQREPDLMQDREVTRANYFARANVEDPQQRLILESYLLDPQRATAELQTFAGLFPSGNFMISYNLLTPTTTPTRGNLAQHDAEALRVVEGWMADPRFEKLKPQLQEISNRLKNFVGKP
jgi:hypothetical protein